MINRIDEGYDDPWGRDIRQLGLSPRAMRILRLQGFHTIRQLALGLYDGSFEGYPAWLVEAVEQALARCRSELEAANARFRQTQLERQVRLSRVDWSNSILGRALSPEEIARLSRVDVKRLRCTWDTKNAPTHAGARCVAETAALTPDALLSVKGFGAARMLQLRAAIERALSGDVEDDWTERPMPAYAVRDTLVGRSLTPRELMACDARAVGELALPARACRVALTLRIQTCLDLGALRNRDVMRLPYIGGITYRHLRQAVHECLTSAHPPATVDQSGHGAA